MSHGLVAWYPLDGNGTDHSATANHATVTGATPTADRHGVEGKALLFGGSGSNHYLEAPFNQALSSTAISYSVWTKPTSTTSNHGSPITFRADGRGFNLYKLPDNTWSHWTGSGGWQKFHAQAISLNWTALAFTHDGTTGKAYQNGVLVVSSNKTYLPAQSGSLKIGAGTGGSGPTYFFKGAIDEVRIWNRVLSSSEISDLYSMESTPAIPAGTTYRFYSAGATGREGPTQSQVDANYSGTNLANSVTINTRGIQEWTVPATGTYGIEASEPPGDSGSNGSGNGGKGAAMRGNFSLQSGQVIRLIVGQQGLSAPYEAGGGGGTFVFFRDKRR